MTPRFLRLASVLALCAASPLTAQRREVPRIVSLGGAITETIFALGAGERVVAVDRSSRFPAAVTRLPDVGYFRQAGAEGILAQSPTLVLADSGAPAATIQQLRAAGVRVELMPVGDAVAVSLERIRRVGAALGRTAAADVLARTVSADIERAKSAAARRPDSPKVLLIYARGMGTLFVAGRNTGADVMLSLAHATNAAADVVGYRALTAEAVATSDADVIVLPTGGLASVGGVSGVLSLPGVSSTPAGRTRRVVTVADDLLLGFGPRIALGIDALAAAVRAPAVRPAASTR